MMCLSKQIGLSSRDCPESAARIPDPRAAITCYLCWYALIWVESVPLLVGALAFHAAIAVLLGVFTSPNRRLLAIVGVIGALLTTVALLTHAESPEVIVTLWCKWLVIVLASLSLSRVLSPQSLFYALRSFRVPDQVVLALAIAVRFLPIVSEQTWRVVVALRARGITGGTGLGRVVKTPRFLLAVMVPSLVQLLKRAEQIWFTIELRGLRQRLFRPRAESSSLGMTIVTLLLAPLPVIAAFIF